jgi:hypothetical protein
MCVCACVYLSIYVLNYFSSVRYYLNIDVLFRRSTPDGTEHTWARFRSPVESASNLREFDIEQLVSTFLAVIDSFNTRNSGWIVERLISCDVWVAALRPMVGSSYIPSPPHIEKNGAMLNIFETTIIIVFYIVF